MWTDNAKPSTGWVLSVFYDYLINKEYLITTMAVNVGENIDEVKGFEAWLKSVASDYKKLASSQRLDVLCRLSTILSPSELYDYSNYMTDLLHRDFISTLPAELVDHLLSYVDHKSLLSACSVSI